MTHKLASGETFDIVRGNQTVRVPFAATDPASAATATLATEAALSSLRSKSDLAVYDANGNPESGKSLAVLDDNGALTIAENKAITFKADGYWPNLSAGKLKQLDSLFALFNGETMSANPTQNEMADAIKKIFVALGGTVQSGN